MRLKGNLCWSNHPLTKRQLPSFRYAPIIPPILLKLQRCSEIQNSPLPKNEKWRQRRFPYERQTPCERARCHLGDKRFRAIRNDRATSSTEGGRCPNDFDRPEIRKTSGDEARHKSGLLRR